MKIKLSLVLLSANLFAGVVNPNFYYQDYLDFGTNKGKFKVGENFLVTSKDGRTLDFKVPVPDFSAANQSGELMGELTNIGGSYAITAAHMISPIARPDLIQKGKGYEFGNVKTQVVASDTNFKDYFVWNKNCKEYKESSELLDFAVVKMSKLNINKSAKLIDTNFFYKEKNIPDSLKNDQVLLYQDKYFNKTSTNEWDNTSYQEYIKDSKEIDDENIGKGILINNPQRFSVYARSGSGIQRLGYLDSRLVPRDIIYDGEYLSGGVLYLNTITSKGTARVLYIDSVSENKIYDYGSYDRLDFSNSPAPGDSGSAIYVYDNELKEWLVVGVVSKSNCNSEGTNDYSCSTGKYAFINHFIIDDFKNDFSTNLNGGVYESASIKAAIKDKYLENNKDLIFNGATTINLNDKENLGSSVFYFNDNSTVNGEEVLLGGVVIDEGKTLNFNAKTGLNDNLFKMGKGILNITKESEGGFRSGEGLTILNTTNKAFSSVYLLNDAALKITNANQVDLNRAIFNGGILDINGANLNISSIKANDIRTKIINSNNAISSISLNDKSIYHGQIGKNIDVKIGANDVVFDGALDINNLDVSSGKAILQGHPLSHFKAFSLLDNPLVGDVYTITSVRLDQDDWEQREFNINNISVKNSSLEVLKHSTLNANKITLENSSLNVGENTAYIDGFDGANVVNDTTFQSTFTSGFSKAKDIFVNADVYLNANSSLNIKNGSYFSGSINDDKTGSLNLDSVNIEANINIANLNASNTNFYFALNKTLNVTSSAMGSLNTFMVKPSLAGENKYLLASINNIDNSIKEDYLKALEYKDNISVFSPNIEFINEDGKANWYLVKLSESKEEPTSLEETPSINIPKEPSINDYFFVQENKELTNTIETSLNQVFFSYVLEWNNMQKRMGELREQNTNYGSWARMYFGKSSYKNTNHIGFFETQIGFDKLNDLDNFSNYTGFVFNASKYKLNDNLNGDIKGLGFGLYSSTLFNNGFYVDFIAKYLNYKNDFNLVLKNKNDLVNTLNAIDKSYAIVSSVELGYRHFLNKAFYLEPQLELISGYVSKQELKSDDLALSLKTDSFVPLNMKTALFGGYNSKNIGFRLGFGLANDLKANAKKTITDLNITSVKDGTKDKRVFVNLNSNIRFNKHSNLSFEFEKSFMGDFNIDSSFNLVYRYGF